MMMVNGISGTNGGTQTGSFGSTIQMDSVSKNIQNQIANAQKKLQELSSNQELSVEDKMKKLQEIRQEITSLNQQLRQHQLEQRKEQQTKKAAPEEFLGSRKETAVGAEMQSAGLSQNGMQAMIMADSYMKQAKVQGSVATRIKGRAGVLESEIKMDKGRGASTKKKEEELAALQARAQAMAGAQASTLTEASMKMEEAVTAAGRTETIEATDDKTTEKTEIVTESKE